MYWKIYPVKSQDFFRRSGTADEVFRVKELTDGDSEEWVADFAEYETACEVVYNHNVDVFDSVAQEMDDEEYANHKKFVEMRGYLY